MVLDVRNCSVVIQQRIILNQISFTTHGQEVLSIIGPSGAGKTTLLRCLAGLQKHSGTIWLGKQRLDSVPTPKRQLGFVDQQLNLFPHLTVLENIAFPLRLRRWPKPAIADKVKAFAQTCDIAHCLDRLPQETSGGEQQRVALARALIYEPRLLLLDEPFGSLDAMLRFELMHWLQQLLRQYSVPTLFVTHDIREARFLSQRTLYLDQGKIKMMDQAIPNQ